MQARYPRALLLVAPLLLAACSVAATPAASLPGTKAPTVLATQAPSDEPTTITVPTAEESATDVPTPAGPPSPPKNFRAVAKDGTTPCPSPDAETGDFCKEVDLAWTSTAPGSWFRIYSYWTGLGDVTCDEPGLIVQAVPLLDTEADATSTRIYNGIATGGGAQCLWITANTDAGESDPVAPAGQ
jgi:hypothetical protein